MIAQLLVVVAAATAAATVAVTVRQVSLAPRTGQATPIYAFAPVIPLIPGTYMFEALTGLLELTSGGRASSLIVDSVVVDVSVATLTIVALAVGTIGPTLLAGRRIADLVARQALDETEG